MQSKKVTCLSFCITAFILVSQGVFSQDKIYFTDGRILSGKVTEIGPTQIRFYRKDRPDGPVYIINNRQVDSIIYSNGGRDIMSGSLYKRDLHQNIPELNTVSGDILGMVATSVSLSYERRTIDGIVGFRVPLYIGFLGGSIAGMDLFQTNGGVFFPQEAGGGFSIATGFNPKFYLFRHRIVRAFIGPEGDIGFSLQNNYGYYGSGYTYMNEKERDCTVAGLVRFGLMITPKDKFNLTIDGGVGAGDLFGGLNPIGLVGVWHIGLALGGNF